MVSERKLASSMGGKTTRACDNCIKRRARWYCPADDAFLCQSCDAFVHSANPLAHKHERVRLKTSSLKESSSSDNYFLDLESSISISSVSVSSWHCGVTRKARTPRHGRKASKSPWDGDVIRKNPIHLKASKSPRDGDVIRKNPIHLVPEILSDENSYDEIEKDQLLYRVPILDSFLAQLCRNHYDMVENNATAAETNSEFKVESKEMMLLDDVCNIDLKRFHEMQPSEMELAEFTSNVESLLGKGLDEESFDMEGFGLLGVCSKEENSSMECSMISHEKVKIEDEGEMEVDTKTTFATTHGHMFDHTHHDIDINGDTFEFKFDYDSSMNISEDNNGVVIGDENNEKNKKKILLNLDYEGVLTAWADQRSPWTNGERPELDSNDSWPDCMGNYMGENVTLMDSGREARVSRYREKRRTRLFSKKIRYEVRKLNAEKRPRMKGRFVKKVNFATTTTSNYPLVK